MRKMNWQKWAMSLMSGGVLLQTSGCVETGVGITALATSITAGGVIYLIIRIID